MTKPLVYTVSAGKAELGCGTTKLYELMAAGFLDARKLGGRTVITGESIHRYVESLPPADIRTKPRWPSEPKQAA